MIVETFISDLEFSSALAEIAISGLTTDLDFTLSRKVNNTYTAVLQERYTPDADGRVYVMSINKVINKYISESGYGDFKFTFMSDGDTQELPLRVIYSRVNITTTARIFTANKYMSLLSGTKSVLPQSLEYLWVYSPTADSVSVSASFRNADGTYTTATVTPPETVVPDTMTRIDVSPANYILSGSVLVKYTVTCGARSQVYEVDNVSLESPLEVMFKNNFGVAETFATMGNLQSESKAGNNFGYIRRQYVRYDGTVLVEYTANTGILTQQQAAWIPDLFMSNDVVSVVNRGLRHRLTITDWKAKRTSDAAELPSFEFKYRLSDANQEVFVFSDAVGGVFDQTFDQTFN